MANTSILQKQMKETARRQRDIASKINDANIKPTEKEEKLSKEVILKISKEFSEKMKDSNIDEFSDEIRKAIIKECSNLDLDFEGQQRVQKTVLMTALGHGPIEAYLQDPEVTEIVVQNWDNIVVEKNGKIYPVEATFNNEEHLVSIIRRIVQRVNRQITVTSPIVDARLKDGSRVNAVIRPVSPDGAMLTIRKFNNAVLSGRDYLKKGSINKKMLYFLERCVKARISIFVSGGTGTGKTTLLNMLSSFIPNDELIVTIEDSCELKLQQDNVRRMETRTSGIKENQVTIKDLVKNSLRMRPDRIIVGEIRDGSIVDMLSAMSTGHEGSMSTGHANSPENLVNVRMPILFSMNEDATFSERSQSLQIAEAIQLIVQISRFPDGSRKITNISHVHGVTKDGKVNIEDIFIYDREEKRFRATGYVPEDILTIFRNKEIDFEDEIFTT